MVDGDRLAQIEEGLREAAAATTDLRLSVQSLSAVAGEVAALQRSQAETRAKAEAADKKGDAATEHTIAVDRLNRKRWSRVKLVGVLAAAGGIALLLLVSFLTFRSAVIYVQDLTQRVEQRAERADRADQESRYAGCVTRNRAVQAQADRERRLAVLAGISRAEASIHAQSATELDRLAVDCTKIRRVP